MYNIVFNYFIILDNLKVNIYLKCNKIFISIKYIIFLINYNLIK
jgi:hypothetical protein